MPITLVSKGRLSSRWKTALNELAPDLEIRLFQEDRNKEEVEFVISWNHEIGSFDLYPNLKVICSMGAGVDHLFRDKNLPADVAIVRIVDQELSNDMNEFVLSLIMSHLRGLNNYRNNESIHYWKPRRYKTIKDVRLGIMGFGTLGQSLAKYLLKLDFRISGWSNSPKTMEQVATFYGQEQLAPFLSQTDILICLLPLTETTRGILNKQVFDQLPKGAFLINVGRGGHLNEADLVDAIEREQLSGASLDVFEPEPMPEDHAFWDHPKIHITPHVASLTIPKSVAPQILENYRRMQEGLPLLNEVSREKGY